MKNFFAALALLISAQLVAQPTVTEQFQKISSLQQAEQYIKANAALKPEIFSLSADKDSSLIAKRLLRQKKGDVFSVGNVTYKVLEAKDTVNYRASYIFLDPTTYSPAQIDSLKNVITQKLKQGVAFEVLSDQYTMDGNTTRGDTDWFYGEYMMPKEFQDAVEKNKKGDIFFLDAPDKQWHYIIKKTHDDRVEKEVTVLRANGR